MYCFSCSSCFFRIFPRVFAETKKKKHNTFFLVRNECEEEEGRTHVARVCSMDATLNTNKAFLNTTTRGTYPSSRFEQNNY
jgi:hypothetical protein